MARARNIKPGLFVNDELAELHPLTRLLFIGLWTIADREGRLEDKPKKIAAQVLPYDDYDVDSALEALTEAGFIQRYTANNVQYIQVVNFAKHQNPHKNEAESSIPAPEQHSTSTIQAPEQHTTNPADSLNPITDSLSTDSLREKDAPPKGSAKATRIPENWELSAELQEWTFLENPRIDIKRVLDSFTDYWRSVPAAKGRKLDWDATWRNWVRRENGNSGTNRTRETAVQRSQRLEREYLAERGVSIP